MTDLTLRRSLNRSIWKVVIKPKEMHKNQSCDVVLLRALPNEGFFEEVYRQNLTV